MQVEHATPLVGSIVTIDRDDFLSGRFAAEIQQFLVERSALVFPGMHLTEAEQLQFARTIGEVFLVGGKETQNISMDREINPVADYTRGAFFWHIDGANDPIPAKATMLSVKIMPEGDDGDTLVANTYAAYADLPEDRKAAIDTLRVRHALESSQRLINPDPSVAELRRWQAYPGQTHPLVWKHRHGRPSLLIGATAHYVEDMNIAEGNMLLCELQEWATQDRYVYRHKWQPGDFLIFDNTGAMHRAAPYALDAKRLMLRTTLHGEEPIA
jgi:alpha-ketoglutarate-dependent taurine dioxygenase